MGRLAMGVVAVVLVAVAGLGLATSQGIAPPGDEMSVAIKEHNVAEVARLIQSRRPADMSVPMEVAIDVGDVAIVKLLLTQGASASYGYGSATDTPLMKAARLGENSIISVLADAGADPNVRCGPSRQYFPLYAAVLNHHWAAATLLLYYGADPNAWCCADTGSRMTPLMIAASQGDGKIVEALLRWGADPNLADERGRRAVDWLKEYKPPTQVIAELLKNPPPRTGQVRRIDASDREGHSKSEAQKRPAAVPVSGLYTDMHFNPDTGDIGGTEIFIVPSMEPDKTVYHALVQFAFGMPDAPDLVPVRVVGELRLEFDIPNTKLGTFRGEITATALTGEFANGVKVNLRRGKSFWQ